MPAAAEETLPISFGMHTPAKPLREFVRALWYWRGHAVPYSRERILPSGTAGLIINLASGRTSHSGISGPASESFLIERTVQDEIIGVQFDVGGAFPFLGFPCSELHNLGITLSELCGESKASELICLLHEARTMDKKFQALEKWLMRLLTRPLEHHPAVSFAMAEFERDPGLLSSADVAERMGLSQRRFIQLFKDEVGLTPKLLCRIHRFQQVIRGIEKKTDVDWLDIALSRGYFDQAHFIHDFQEFSGLTPRDYLGLRTEYLSHVRVP